jgi:glutaredoxin
MTFVMYSTSWCGYCKRLKSQLADLGVTFEEINIEEVPTLDAELKHLIQESDDATAIGSDIKRFLLDVLNDNANDQEKFSDTRIAQAQRILDRAGPASFYWMTEIAAQLATLSAAQINGIPTNVNAELGSSANPRSNRERSS